MDNGNETMVDRISMLMEERGVKQSFIEGLLNGYRGKITEWKKGKSTPTVLEVNIIADFFDVTPDYLMCRTDERNEPFQQFAKDDVKVVARIQGNLPKEDADELYRLINENFDKFMASRGQNGDKG
ncbi:MAG: helix-turn-helix domain-containing protein [Defluviitaleaceae bacterium]|nr:helix-turn-helix domain-containing protein [Defluviitaleaceae bacterium]